MFQYEEASARFSIKLNLINNPVNKKVFAKKSSSR
jgi:hypothetical protein